ncbi:DUF2975 domain-containing protein [Tissierella sp.]|uniref:DUF2975 domain-containing protein n=1 Tax=Tissierella sp. TaxID=41274 RepID=UPI002866CABB|nr:DUF2975 domain-containing protein [Tissierella sp.]MDR7857220.1 DUF2975 domain-containing protein [Tissierella sp.]
MEYVKRVKVLKGLLNVIGSFFLLLLFLSMISTIAAIDNNGIKNTVLSFIFSLLFFGCYFMIILALRKVLKSIEEKNPFTTENIIHFKKIGYYILSVGVIDAISNYSKPNYTGIDLIGTPSGSLKPMSLFYIILCLLAFILADVFKMAIDIKDENDLTV